MALVSANERQQGREPACREPACREPARREAQRGLDFHREGCLAEALACYERAIDIDPDYPAALHLAGAAALQSHAPERALGLIDRSLALDPASADAHCNRGVALRALGRDAEAMAAHRRAIERQPQHLLAHQLLAEALSVSGEEAAALLHYEQVLSLDPAHIEARNGRGVVLARLGRFDAALQDFDAAIAVDPHLAAAHCNRGNVLAESRRLPEALASFDRALQLQTDFVAALVNRAPVLQELGDFDAALASCERALAIEPGHAEALVNRGNIYQEMTSLAPALASYDQAIARAPEYALAHVNRAMALLMAGDYARGWADYEWRWYVHHGAMLNERRSYPQPQWTGVESLAGKTILLHSEQGLGDTLQFCRYARAVADLGANVVLEVQHALKNLLARLDGVTEVHAPGDVLPRFDYYISLMSLPLAFKTCLASVPAPRRYLEVDPACAARWRARLGAARRPRVGLAWSGGFRAEHPKTWAVNARRNIPLAKLAPLRDVEVDFFSLQKGEPAQAELAQLLAERWPGPILQDFTAELGDFVETAALIEQLDLVVTVDTSIAHLAGALGKPVWILNRFDGCWRWLLARTDSPWYPTARLYRQQTRGDWDGVVQRLAADLQAYALERGR